MHPLNREVRLKARPTGIPQAEHFEIVQVPIAKPKEGQIVVRNLFLSIEPAMRGWVILVSVQAETIYPRPCCETSECFSVCSEPG